MRSIGGILVFALAVAAATTARAQPLGPEFRVNTYLGGPDFPRTAVAGDGSFVVVWRNGGQPGGSYDDVYAQRYTSTGAPIGGEFRVNAFTPSNQLLPAAAFRSTGEFIVAWMSEGGEDGDAEGVFAQRFTSVGVPLGSGFRVNTYTTGGQYAPSVAYLGSAGFVVAWSSAQNEPNSHVYGQRFNTLGAPVGGEFRVDQASNDDAARAVVAADASGSFVVAWTRGGQPYFRRFDSAGVPTIAETPAAVFGGSDSPGLALLPGGDFVVVWSSDDPSLTGTYGQRFSSSGATKGPEFRVNTTTTGNQYHPAVASDSFGDFLVTWASSSGQDGDATGVFAQRFHRLGAPLGVEFRVNTYTTSSQSYPAVAADAAGRFLVAWTSRDQIDTQQNVFAQRFAPMGLHGDVNGDGAVTVADVFYLINNLFAGGVLPLGPGDVNGDTQTTVADIFYLINNIFAAGPAPL